MRIDRMIEAITVLRGLWGDDAFSFDGEHYTITEMKGLPKPVQAGGPPIVVGGGSKRVLSTAARLADIVGVNPNVGEGKFGAEAIASMSADATDEKLGWVRAAAGDRFDDIEISILKFFTVVTDDRDTVADKVGGSMGMDAATLLASPHSLVGFGRAARRRVGRTTRAVAGVVRHRAGRRLRGVRAGRRRARRDLSDAVRLHWQDGRRHRREPWHRRGDRPPARRGRCPGARWSHAVPTGSMRSRPSSRTTRW